MKTTCKWATGKTFTLREEVSSHRPLAPWKLHLSRRRTINICAFIQDNRDGLSTGEVAAIKRMRSGGRMDFGGGAAPFFLLERVK